MNKKLKTNESAPLARGWARRIAQIDTRQEILDNAMALLSKRGFEATKMRDIASAVGIKAASIYNHFSSKNEILFAVLFDAMQTLLARCQASIESHTGNPSRQLVEFVKAHTLLQIEAIDVIPLLDAQLLRKDRTTSPLTSEQHLALNELQDDVVSLLKGVLQEGKQCGEMHFPDATVTTFMILGAIEHIPYWYDIDGRIRGQELAESIATLALTSVRGINA